LPGDNLGLGRSSTGYTTEALTLLANHVAPYVALNLSLLDKRLTITPQLRVQTYTFNGEAGATSFSHAYVVAEPRLSARYQLTPGIALRGAVGRYSQAPDAQALSPAFGNPALRPQTGMHYVVGGEVAVTPKLQVTVDAFYKTLDDLVVRGTDPAGPISLNAGRGRAYGAELMVRQQLTNRFFGWLSYTLSRGERQDHPGEPWHTFQYDQTHILTLVGSYMLPRGFQVGARYRYVTGNPQTPVVGAYYDANRDSYRPITGTPYSARLEAFSQLDLRLDKTWTFDRWRLSAYLDLQNVTNSRNAEATEYNFNYRQARGINGLPLLPVVGIRGDF
jgi:hypothetical protein